MERINVRKSDLQMLNETASSVLEEDANGDVSEFLKSVNERFQHLEDEVAKKRDFFGGLVDRWSEFTHRKRRISELFQRTSSLIVKRQITSAYEVQDQLVQCKKAIHELENNGVELNEINEYGRELMAEFRDEGFDVEVMEKDLHAVNDRYNEIKLLATRKEDVLKHVAVEWEKLDDDKMELESWLKDVHEQLSGVDEDSKDFPQTIQVGVRTCCMLIL